MKEQYEKNKNRKRSFSRVSSMSILLLQISVFAYVWLAYYNFYTFRTHRIFGGIASVLLYYIIYNRLTRIYRANKIAMYSIGEIVFSQLLAFGITDLIFYTECCFIARGYVSIIPGLFAVVVQFLISCMWALISKRYCINNIPPQETLIIYGNESVGGFIAKLGKKPVSLLNIRRKTSAGEEIDKLYKQIDCAEVVILYQVEYKLREELMNYCIEKEKVFYVTPTVTDIIATGFENRHIIDSPLMKYNCYDESFEMVFVKRFVDIIISLLALVLTLPITILTMIAIKLEDGGSVFFKQERYTKDWKRFNILKFRSMVMNAEENGALLCSVNDSRITKVGSIIRRFRIDEIPQLLNVLKGDMSLVGPRPERVENVEKYTEELPQFAYRLQVKSGLTGYAQLYGKYNTSAYDKLCLDLIYIENRSLILDFKLIMLTIKILFIPESTEGFSDEAVRLMQVGGKKWMV